MLRAAKLRGFTIIEVLITVSLMSILMFLGQSVFTTWTANAKARSLAEAIQNGVRAAQAEAVRRNRQVAFVLTNAAPAANVAAVANGRNWYIQVLPIVAGETVNTPYVQGSSTGSLTAGMSVTGPALICFNSQGRITTNSAAAVTTAFGMTCAATTANYAVTSTSANVTDRTFNVQVAMGGKVRMCDASRTLSTTNPDGC
ncbi:MULTISPECIES: GspH/FimT family pseudopilin [unclassified Undibacterium]|uniref:GspH/FimT family pseudopilin n=1 Tax=unclassified Undibacterium TaxID=2630295 RepID=UPI002AC8C09F|nr:MULTISPECIES: prepilin-type N-terminal cleavage/methylation domain-containing protein [unclassified Undibacterium]MEB0139490.1 GspH/FimT family pseudopilin [Undibacterium sp. CCC2.1]MEB0172401.1 GspH/FimT family pseudopilin [Undibacterium sp. CCC1.1]MEB0175728.1 GspH/FimT family pseudopilin [Undibacterium sp. CCC3.4]MEB0214516.1 GspH/FimT family pseudopilin [Undibacterium sp. 5I2]WPX42911.1 GspH/FimT family pseudopilin [Undibacterium sp. CCC3.4]